MQNPGAGTPWTWDPSRQMYYVYLTVERVYHYQDGSRIPLAGPATSGYQGPTSASLSEDLNRLSLGSDSPSSPSPAVRSRHYGPMLQAIVRDPAGPFTDPKLRGRGYLSTTKIGGTSGDVEPLDPKYKVRKPARKFFIRGKVFRILWPEPAGSANEGTVLSQGQFNEPFHTKIRWFVVIREGATYCSCLPIQTYGGQGVAKPSAVNWEHAIIYTGDKEPKPTEAERPPPGEKGMQHSIRVKARSSRTDRMDIMSRINFAKIYTVEHNVKVYEFGDVRSESMRQLVKNFTTVWDMAEFRNRAAMTAEALEEEEEEEEEEFLERDDEGDEDENEDTQPGAEHPELQNMTVHNFYLGYYIDYFRKIGRHKEANELQESPYSTQVVILERLRTAGSAGSTSGKGKEVYR